MHSPSGQYARADIPRSIANSFHLYANPGSSHLSTFEDTPSQPGLSVSHTPIPHRPTTGAYLSTSSNLALCDSTPVNTIYLASQLYLPSAEYGHWSSLNNISAQDAYPNQGQGAGSTMRLSPPPFIQNISHSGPTYSSSSSSWTGTPSPSEAHLELYQYLDISPYPPPSQLDQSTSSMLGM